MKTLTQLVSVGNVTVVLELCGRNATFSITEDEVTFLDSGDAHETGFETMVFVHQVDLQSGNIEDAALARCRPILYIFPTAELEHQYASDSPVIFTLLTALLFGASIFLFGVYDKYATRRQNKVESEANRTDAIISDLFPGRLRDMVIQQDDSGNEDYPVAEKGKKDAGVSRQFQADFYPTVSVMFADIDGFAAWSSMREPSQVFALLENVFSAFDQ